MGLFLLNYAENILKDKKLCALWWYYLHRPTDSQKFPGENNFEQGAVGLDVAGKNKCKDVLIAAEWNVSALSLHLHLSLRLRGLCGIEGILRKAGCLRCTFFSACSLAPSKNNTHLSASRAPTAHTGRCEMLRAASGRGQFAWIKIKINSPRAKGRREHFFSAGHEEIELDFYLIS